MPDAPVQEDRAQLMRDDRYLIVLSIEDTQKLLEKLNEEQRQQRLSTVESALQKTGVLLWYLFLPTGLYSLIASACSPRAKGIIDNIKALQDRGLHINVLPLDAPDIRKLAGSSLRPNTLYIRHPFRKNRYLLAANYNQVVFEETFAELVEYCRAFGPKTLTVQMSQSGARRVEASANNVARTDFESTSEVFEARILYSGNWTEGQAHERRPSRWLRNSVVLSAVNESVIEFARQISFEFTYGEEHGFNEDYKLLSHLKEHLQISLGGSVESKKGTTLKVAMTFEDDDDDSDPGTA